MHSKDKLYFIKLKIKIDNNKIFGKRAFRNFE